MHLLRSEILFQLGGVILIGVLIGLIFILVGIIYPLDLSLRIGFIILGFLIMIAAVFGFKNFKNFKWG